MSEAARALATQFDDLEQQHDAATLGMWIFLVTEIMFFAACSPATRCIVRFTAGLRGRQPPVRDRAGAINTAVLISSSLTMALAVRAAQVGRRRTVVVLLFATMLLGTAFLGIKFVEYGHKYAEHLIPGSGFAYADRMPSRFSSSSASTLR